LLTIFTTLLAYLLGGLPFGYWFVRLSSGKDIRTLGSGNIGATNVHRTSGGKAGIIVLLLDILKGYLAVLIAALVNPNDANALALAVIAVLGPGKWVVPGMPWLDAVLIGVLAITGWPVYTRVIRAQTLSLREREFIQAGRLLGARDSRLITRHILPNVVNLLVVLASLQVAQMIILESFLSFLGLGVQPPIPSWGSMLGDGRLYMFDKWWMATIPGLAIFVTTLAINLVGDGLRDLLDPYSRTNI